MKVQRNKFKTKILIFRVIFYILGIHQNHHGNEIQNLPGSDHLFINCLLL